VNRRLRLFEVRGLKLLMLSKWLGWLDVWDRGLIAPANAGQFV